MKDNELDKLFREKLQRREVKASEKAWKQLSNELNKDKKKTLFYWSAAAVVFILASFSLFMMNQNGKITSDSDQLADSEIVQQEKRTEEKQVDEKPERAVEDVLQVEDENEPPERLEGSRTEKINSSVKADVTDELLAQEKHEPAQKDDFFDNDEENADVNEESQTEEDPIIENGITRENEGTSLLADGSESAKPKSYPQVKIVYKKSDNGSNERDGKNGIKKVIELAKDIKQGEYGIGDLREAKNELLAFGLNKISDEK